MKGRNGVVNATESIRRWILRRKEFLDCFLYFPLSMVYQLLLLSPCKAGPPPIKDINKFWIFGLNSVFSIFYGLSAVTAVNMQGRPRLSKISINLEFLDWILYFLLSMVYQLLPAVTMQAGPPIKDINKFWILDWVLYFLFSLVQYISCYSSHHAGMARLSKISINFEFLDWILYFLFSMVYQLLLLSPCGQARLYQRYQ